MSGVVRSGAVGHLADELERVDKSFAANMGRLDPDWMVS